MAWPVRYNMIGLLFLSTVVNYIDRVNISVAAPVIMKETGWDKGQFGLVFSAFLIGYALLQIPGGVIADRWGGRKVLALAFCGFSLFTALTPFGQSTFVLLLLMRFLVGAFESVTIPALTSLNSRWIPRAEFGRAQTLSLSGITVGQMVAYPLTTWIILHFSWQMVFYLNAVLGVGSLEELPYERCWASSGWRLGYGTQLIPQAPIPVSGKPSVTILPCTSLPSPQSPCPCARCSPIRLYSFSLSATCASLIWGGCSCSGFQTTW